jgi:hypothetical protein
MLQTISMPMLANYVGMVGVGLVLIAYFLLHVNYYTSEGKSYSLLNLIGACCVMFSLYYHWNTPAVIMEGTWILISLYGVCKSMVQSADSE